MTHFIITYDVSKDESREKLKRGIEKLGLREQHSNQTTHFGTFSSFSLLNLELLKIFGEISFTQNDFVTVYKTTKNTNGACDIEQVRVVINGTIKAF